VTSDVTISVNGVERVVRCDPESSVLQVLRGQLGLLGSRFGCGLGACGACMVLLDGRPVTSCDTPMWSVGSAHITTIEALAEVATSGVALAAAFEAEQAGQCGYCLSGILVTASALIDEAAGGELGETAVRAALDRHLCRCGTHGRIVRAVLRAANPDGPTRDPT
jgi:nicotinate dehydrogenase subunit A